MSVSGLIERFHARGIELWLEGERLRYRAPPGALTTALRDELSASRAEVIACLRDAASRRTATCPLSYNQRSIWFIQQQAPDTAAYHISVPVRVHGTIDEGALRQAMQGLIDRHAILRTTYDDIDGNPMQRVAGAGTASVTLVAMPGADEAALRRAVEADFSRPFDLREGPVCRVSLYSISSDLHVLLLAVHHIAADGWSLLLLFDELLKLYAGANGNAPALLPRPEMEFTDYCAWQEKWLEGPDGERLWQYWREKLAPPLSRIDLPTDFPRLPVRSFRGSSVEFVLDAESTGRVKRLARAEGTTMFVLLLAAFKVLLHRLTANDDLIVGTPTFARGKAELLRTVGSFVNTVALRTALDAGVTFRESIARVRRTVMEALDAQELPLPLLVQRLQPERDPSRMPLFDTFFVYQRFDQFREYEKLLVGDGATVEAGGLRLSAFPLNQQEGQFDLCLRMAEGTDEIRGLFNYNPDLFQESTIRRIMEAYRTLVSDLSSQPDMAIGRASGSLRANAGAGAPEDAIADPVPALLQRLEALDVRLWVEGGRLRVNAPRGSLDDDLKQSIARHKEGILRALLSRTPEAAPPGAAAPGEGGRPEAGGIALSFAQRRLWFLDRVDPGRSHYNVSLVLRLSGAARLEPMEQALREIVRRHEVLRLAIPDVDGLPVPTLTAATDDVVGHDDVSHLPAAQRETEALRIALAAIMAPFDLARGPLAAFRVIRLAHDDHLLVVNMHHIASDGWSLSIAVREFGELYQAFSADRESPLVPLPLQYAAYAAEQLREAESADQQRHLAYWRKALAGAPAVIELPTDRPRPPVPSLRGRTLRRRMTPALLESLKRLSSRHGCTLYMTLLSAWQVLLHRYSGQDDIVVGSPMANRDRPGLEQLIGCFVNNVVQRGRLGGNPRFSEYLAANRTAVLDAFEHSEIPFEALVQGLNLARSADHAPVFQVLMALHTFPMTGLDIGGLHLEPVEIGGGTARFDLALDLVEFQGELRAAYEYATDLFDEATIARMHECFVTLLEGIVADPTRRLDALPLLPPADAQQLLGAWNDTGLEHDRSRCVHQLLEASARRHPDALAVLAGEAMLTYGALDARANRLARLLAARGVSAGDLVAVCLDRTADMAVAIAAVLKAGAAYVPLDPTHPADRLRYTLEDSGARCALTQTPFEPLLAGAAAGLVALDAVEAELAALSSDPVEVAVAPEDLAYVIYTSGSTGRPKGVEVEHRNVVNFIEAMRREPGFTAADRLLAVTTLSFDIAGLEFWLPFATGGQVVVASRTDVLDGARLAHLLREHAITVMQATPATWRLMLDAGWEGKPDLTILCGGEALPRELAATLSQRVGALWNMYGPTETTIWSTAARITDAAGGIPIGRPIANTRVYVLEPGGAHAPIGVAGELCIGGEGVARGYRDRPDLTADRFVAIALPDGRSERVYRTGDVVRFRNDGMLAFIGRRDHQVKLRGYRIELGEIEAVLGKAPGVRECVAAVREDVPGDQRLVGYVVPAGADAFEPEEARAALRAQLPEYMVPGLFVTLEALPLTPNGKIDRKALPAPAIAQPVDEEALDALMTPVQQRVAAIWRQVLQVGRVGLHDNFFDLGGHSLLLVRLQSALRAAFGVDLALVELFQRTTVSSQSERFAPSSAGSDDILQRARARAGRRMHG